MIQLMTIGSVQEPSTSDRKYYFPTVNSFDVTSEFAVEVQALVEAGKPLEDLQNIAKDWLSQKSDGEGVYKNTESMVAAFVDLEKINRLLIDADYEGAAKLIINCSENSNDEYKENITALYDSILAFSILNEGDTVIELSRDYIKIVALIKRFRAGTQKSFPTDKTQAFTVKDYHNKALPHFEFKLPRLENPQGIGEPLPAPPDSASDDSFETCKEKISALTSAISEIEKLAKAKANQRQSAIESKDAFIRARDMPAEEKPTRQHVFGDQYGDSGGKMHFVTSRDKPLAAQNAGKPTKAELSQSYENYLDSKQVDRFDEKDFKQLSKCSQELVSESVGARNGFTKRQAIERLTQELRNCQAQIKSPRAVSKAIYFAGHVVEINDAVFEEIICGEQPKLCHCELLHELDEKHGSTPQLHIMGTGDVYRIDRTFTRYLRGELIHTETVLKGSEKTSSFRKLDRVDEFEETFTSKEEEKETSVLSEDRFKLEKEIERQNQSEKETNFGAKLTAGYGPVSISANYGQSSSSASSDKARQAREVAQKKISKAVSSIKSKSEKRSSVRRISESERNSSFSLKNGDPSFTAYYHAIDKEYSNQLVCVGKRLMVRVGIQESMAFLLRCMATGEHEGATMEKPLPPDQAYNPILDKTLSSFADITPLNYALWANFFGVSGVEAPPASKTASAMTKGNRASEETWPTGGGSITIPDGYQAEAAVINVLLSGGSGRYIHITVGGATPAGFNTNGIITKQLDNLTGETFYTHRGHSDNDYTVVITLECEPTSKQMDAWRISVYDSIWSEYRRKEAAYENMLQSLKVDAGIQIRGQNPKSNEKMIREELMKMVLGATFPQFYYRGLNSMKFGYKCIDGGPPGGVPIPEPDFKDALIETTWVTFMTQLFEFENMTFDFKGYYFANRRKWCTLRKIADVDPFLEKALNSGFVTIDIPIARNMEQAFLHYLGTGQIFAGKGMPLMGDPLYQAIALEIKDAETKDGIPCEEPWLTVMPTSMAVLDDSTPNDL